MEALAAVLNRAAAELNSISFRAATADQFKILTHTLGGRPSKYLNLRAPVICPKCIAENRFISAFWDLAAVRACPHHGVVPLKRCHACDRPLSWHRQGLARCRCGAELLHEWCGSADPMTVALMRQLEAKLLGRPLTDGGQVGFPIEWMEQVTLRGLLDALRLFEHHLATIECGAVQVESMTVASALSEWPGGYHRFLRSVGERSLRTSPGTSGLGKQFSEFFRPAFRDSTSSQDLGFLRRELVAFGLTEWGRGTVDKKLLAEDAPNQPRFVSKTNFARMHGLNTPTLNRMIRDGDVVAVVTKAGRGGRTIIDIEASKTPIRVTSDDMTLPGREAGRRIGLPVAVIKALRRDGTLESPLRTGKGGTWYVADVERFVAKAASISPDLPAHADGLSLARLMRLKFRDAKAKARLVTAALDGTLKPIGRESPAIGGLQFAARDVEPLVVETRVSSAGGTRSLPQAAVACGIAPDVVASAIEQGLLSRVRIGEVERVTAESVETFKTHFSPLIRLATDLKTTVRPLVAICVALGVQLITLQRSNGRPAQPVIPAEKVAEVTREYQERCSRRVLRSFSGRADEQLRRFRAYLDGLAAEGGVLPRHNGLPSKSIIARACGFDRSVLETNIQCAQLLEERDLAERTQGAAKTPRQRLEAYLRQLRELGVAHPRWNGRPNKLRIAQACGFDRSVFDTDPSLLGLLNT